MFLFFHSLSLSLTHSLKRIPTEGSISNVKLESHAATLNIIWPREQLFFAAAAIQAPARSMTVYTLLFKLILAKWHF